MWSIYGELPFAFQSIGRWWGNNPDLKYQAEIDCVAYNNELEQAIFGECKWRNEELDRGVIERLIERSRMFNQFKRKHYYFFSKNGFTLAARELAKERCDIRLLTFNDMFE